MFEQFPNFWTPVLPLTSLDSNPIAAEIAGEKIVLFRDDKDEWHALVDRCPHRGAALSLGTVTPEGYLRCGYHGWRYDGAGRCMAIPMNRVNDAALKKVRATALPTRIIGGALWIHTSTDPGNVELTEPELPESLNGDPDMFATNTMVWNAHWTRAVENFMDFTHPPYLHKDTFADILYEPAESGAVSELEIEEVESGLHITCIDTWRREEGFRVDWQRPNMSVLHIARNSDDFFHIFCIPIDSERTRVMTARRAATPEIKARFMADAASTGTQVLNEDRVIVESQRGDVLSDPAEISVEMDGPSVLFRRWYRTLLAAGSNARASNVNS